MVMQGWMVREILFVCLSLCAAAGAQQEVRVLYVDDDATGVGDGSSWHDAYRFLQDALAGAAAGPKPVEIRVAQGVYRPDRGVGITPGDRGASFRLISGVTLLGGYAGVRAGRWGSSDDRDIEVYETVLSADLKANDNPNSMVGMDNSCRVVLADGTDESAVLDGFTITGAGAPGVECGNVPGDRFAMTIQAGGALVRRCRFTRNSTVALYLRRSTTTILEDCEFAGDQMGCTESSCTLVACRFVGSGLTVDARSNASVTDCTFAGSLPDAIPGTGTLSCYHGSTVVLTGCTVKDSENRGMQIIDCNVVLVGCTFEGNRGGGVRSSGSDLTLLDCRFIRNQGTALDSGMGRRDLRLTGCSFVGNRGDYAGAINSANLVLHDCEFLGNSASLGAGAVQDQGNCFEATGCLFAGNSTLRTSWPGAISSYTTITRLSNCTFADNRGQPATIDRWNGRPSSPVEVTQCIFRDGPAALNWHESSGSGISIAYSDIEGGYPGEGNIDVEPRFVKPGYWADPNDPNVVLGPQDPCAVWVPGDYHLQSQAGHWDRASRTWVYDEATSPCIDAGAPSASVGLEPFPNGGIVNLGAYGGAAEASRSYFGGPVCETQMPGDINGDCRVDEADEAILAARGPTPEPTPENVPPSLTLASPNAGETFTYPTPVVFRPTVTDPDGYVLDVEYSVEYRTTGSGSFSYSAHGTPRYDWERTWEWWRATGVPFNGTCTIRVRALDDCGQATSLPEIQITLVATD
jgi:hypothetical protein